MIPSDERHILRQGLIVTHVALHISTQARKEECSLSNSKVRIKMIDYFKNGIILFIYFS